MRYADPLQLGSSAPTCGAPPTTPATSTIAATAVPDNPRHETQRIFVSYKRDVEPDVSLATFLYQSLTTHGHRVFKDVDIIPTGSDFGELISSEITASDFFIVLLTKASTGPGWVIAETEMARDSESFSGHPKILPVRLAYTQTLPLRFRAAIGHLHQFSWRDATDNEALLTALLGLITAADERARADDTPLPPTVRPSVPSSLLHGEHFIVTERMWQSGAARESVAGTTIVPVLAGQETSLSVTRAAGVGFFRVKILRNGALEVAIWSGANYRRVRSQPRKFIAMMEGDTHTWCFARCMPHEPVLLRPHTGSHDSVAISFDAELVRAAWLVTHQRATTQESFLIVMKHS